MKAMTGQHRWKGKGLKCHHCGHFAHIRRNYRELIRARNASNQKEDWKTKYKMKQRVSSSSENESTGLMAGQVSSASYIDVPEQAVMCGTMKICLLNIVAWKRARSSPG